MYLSLEILMAEAVFNDDPSLNVLPKNDFEKCGFCRCHFSTKIDMKKHLDKFGRKDHEEDFTKLHRKIDRGNEEEEESSQIVWHKAKFGTGEIALASNDQSLARSIEQQGQVRMGMYLYTLSNDKKWIIRKISSE